MAGDLQIEMLDAVLIAGVGLLALAVTGTIRLVCQRAGGGLAAAVQPHGYKLASLEGLRGLLALAVVVHHGYCWLGFQRGGRWGEGHDIPLLRLGAFGVLQFFFISGFLFWRKLMKGTIRLVPFYLSRFVRIAPVYYFSIVSALCVGATVTGLHLREPVAALAGSMLAWGAFTIFASPDVNGANIVMITSGVVWTLGCEWMFYLSLPLLGWFARRAVRLAHLAVLFFAVFWAAKLLSSGAIHSRAFVSVMLAVRQFAKFMLMGFGGGILVAVLDEPMRRRLRISPLQSNGLVVALYAVFIFIPDFPGLQVIGVLLMLAAFALVVQGADMFRLLKSGPMRMLGLISYDLYLVHGLVYYSAMRLRGGMHWISAPAYIAETAGCIVVILILATLVHFVLERPSMRASELIARRDAAMVEVKS